MTVLYSQVTETAPHDFIAEASQLGIRPGQWPAILETEIGNKLPLVRTSAKVVDGDIIHVRYRQTAGCVDLVILND